MEQEKLQSIKTAMSEFLSDKDEVERVKQFTEYDKIKNSCLKNKKIKEEQIKSL